MTSFTKLLFLLSFLAISNLIAQTYNFKTYSTDQGLAQSQVLCIFQDSKGYMWFGTNSGGVSKFDGHKFVTLSKNDGLIDNVVFSVIENQKGELLFATSKGLSIYNGFSFKNYTEKEGLTNVWIYKLHQQGDTVWIGTQGGVFILNKGKIKAFDTDSVLNSSLVYTIFEDDKKNLWFGTYQNGAIRYDYTKKVFDHINKSNGLLDNFAYSIAQHPKFMLIGTTGGLSKIDNQLRVSPASEIRSNENIAFSSILKYGESEFYLGTYAEGLIQYDFTTGKQNSHYYAQNGLTNNPIQCMYRDKEGNLWLGAAPGLFKYYNNKFVYYTKANGLLDNFIDAVGQDKFGNIWLAVIGNGLAKIAPDKKLTNYKADFKDKNTLPDNRVKAILPCNDGKLYFGTEEGLSLYENNTFKTIESPIFQKKYIQSLFQDSRGKIWIGTNQGVFSIFQNQIAEEHAVNTLRKEGMEFMIFFINEDRDGKMVFGLENGLAVFDGSKTKVIGSDKHFTSSRVCSGVRDNKGHFWFGTAEGLFFYDGKVFKKILNPQNASFGFITFLLINKENKLVIGMNNEIELFDLTAFYSGKIKFQHLGKDDGLLSRESNFNAAALDHDGRVLIGTGNGLEIYNPKFDLGNQVEADTKITDLKLFFGLENILDYSPEIDSLSMLPKNLKLPASKNNLTFRFVGISLVAPEKVMYTYKLEGLDKNWTPPDFKTEVVYPAIPPGTYTFMVKAMNNDGLWNKEPVCYAFEILPHWYSTWWFRILAVLLIIVGVWLFIKLREKQLVKEKEALEKTVLERTAEITEQKHIIEEKQQEILDSINYAQRIQRALLASDKLLKENLPEHFVFFKPKDVVSGDFYWGTHLSNGQFALVTADSTGHGVPGAIMSMLNISCLNESVEAKRLIEPKEILNNTRSRIIQHLANDGSFEGGKDGMDCSLVSFDFKQGRLNYAAANNPVWIVRKSPESNQKELIELGYDKMPVGKHDRDRISFNQHEVPLQKGDLVYTLTDGLPDQFGGPKGKKFMYKQLKDLLVSISSLSMQDQKAALSKALSSWIGALEQVDDILIIGVRV